MVTLYAEGDFLISRDEGIVTATFNRAQTRNALTFDMYERLSRLCLEAAEDPSLKAIILTGAGD
ncbi:MAG: enoyl-CoA hydratase, partial [Betaproteobacteria bacterium]|nr:enoyl-CoA hydratase [Betaproteobacteria bacterium]